MSAVDRLPPPPPAAHASGPSWDETRRRAEQERERRKREQAQRAAAEARSRQEEPSGRTSNWLKRETPFVCPIQFRNDLPEVPCDPKMLVDPLNPQQLAAFHLTTLEQEPRRDLVLESDLGIPLTVFDIDRYSVPEGGAQALAPEDAALLEGEEDVAVEASPSMRVRQRLKGSKAELSWLMRTTYISNEVTPSSQAKGISEKQAKVLRDAGLNDTGRTREQQIAAIEASFEAAKQVPEHSKNKSLQPVEIMPVLPDEEQWPNEYGHVIFDAEPTADVPYLSSASAAERQMYAESAVAKPYRIKFDGQDDGFLALLLPAEPPPPRNSEAGPSSADPSAEQELRWIREYNFDMKQDESHRDYALLFRGNGSVSYAEIGFRLIVTARRRQAAAALSASFAKPSRVTLKRRAADEQEEAARAKRLHILRTGYDPDEVEAAADEEAAAATEADTGYADGEDAADAAAGEAAGPDAYGEAAADGEDLE